MRNVVFKKFGMRNFKKHTDLEIDVKEGLTLITGPNASGKTSIFDSIPFCMFGLTSKGNRGKDVVNEKVGKDCFTYIEFELEKSMYRIERYYKDTKNSNDVFMYLDGKQVRKGHNEVVKEIEKLLIPYDLFMNTIFFAQRGEAFFTNLNDTEKKNLLRKLLNITSFPKYYKQVNIEIDELKSQLDNYNSELKVCMKLLENYNNEIDYYRKQKADFLDKKEKRVNLLNSKKSEIINLINIHNLNEYNLDSLVSDRAKICSEIESISSELKRKEENIDLVSSLKENNIRSVFNSKKQELQVNFIKMETEFDSKIKSENNSKNERKLGIEKRKSELNYILSDLEKKRKELEIELDRISNLASICPTCEQNISDETKNNLISSIKLKISDLNNNIDEVHNELNDINSKLSKIEDEYKLIINQIESERINRRSSIDNQISNLSKELNNEINYIKLMANREKEILRSNADSLIRSKRERLYEIEKLIDNIKLKLELDKIEDEIKKESEIQWMGDDNIDKLESSINELLNKKMYLESEMNRISKRYNILCFWKEGFSKSGIESMLLDEYLYIINDRLFNYQKELSHGRYIVSFDSVEMIKDGDDYRDRISIRVVDTESKASGTEKLSGGQERLVNLSIILALHDLQSIIYNIDFNILLFDEVFDALDEQNIVSSFNLLKKLSLNKSVYVISHNMDLSNLDFDESLVLM